MSVWTVVGLRLIAFLLFCLFLVWRYQRPTHNQEHARYFLHSHYLHERHNLPEASRLNYQKISHSFEPFRSLPEILIIIFSFPIVTHLPKRILSVTNMKKERKIIKIVPRVDERNEQKRKDDLKAAQLFSSFSFLPLRRPFLHPVESPVRREWNEE